MSPAPNDFGQYANRHVPSVNLENSSGRELPSPPSLPPLIAPKASSSEILPSLASLDLLDKGRGVYIEPGSDDTEGDTDFPNFDYYLKVDGNEIKLREYRLSSVTFEGQRKIEIPEPYVMLEVANETQAVFHRVTKSGRQLTYHLKVVQPPERARACGSGDKAGNDRRPVDPPPVVSLQVSHNGVDVTAMYESQFMCFVGLEQARPYAHGTLQTAPNPAVLRGSAVAGAAYLSRPFNAAYFIYSDLSVQHEGFYRLKFNLFEQIRNNGDLDMGSTENIAADGPAPTQSQPMQMMGDVYSKPFTVYSAKKFPGLAQSTDLSRAIAEQGCRVRIRRDIRQRKEHSSKGKQSKDSPRDVPEKDTTNQPTLPQQPTHAGNGWNRPEMPDHRLSVATTAMSEAPSRTHSYAHTASVSSPAIAQSPQYHPHAQGPYTPYMVQSPVAEADSYAAHKRPSIPLLQSQQLPSIASIKEEPRPHHTGPSHGYRPPPPSVDPSLRLPPLRSMLPDPNYQPPKPEGLYQTKPMNAKRGFTASRDERAAILKSGARPILTPSSRLGSFSMAPPTPGGHCAPLASGESIIEADAEDEIDNDEDDSADEILMNYTSYRRADGTKTAISTARHSYEV